MDRTFVSRRESRQASCSRSRLTGPLDSRARIEGTGQASRERPWPWEGHTRGWKWAPCRFSVDWNPRAGDWIPASAGMTVVGVDAEGLGLTCSPSFRRYISTTVRGQPPLQATGRPMMRCSRVEGPRPRSPFDGLRAASSGTPQDDNWSQDCRGSSQRRGEGFSAATTRERVSRCLPQAWGCRNGLEVILRRCWRRPLLLRARGLRPRSTRGRLFPRGSDRTR